MCRLFGFRSVLESGVHSSLISADNAILRQGHFHPDGWGVAYYLGGVPHLVKSTQPAFTDSLFKKVSGVVSARTVVAHIRKATHGSKHSLLNSHPFQFGRWIFAHNGNVIDLEDFQEKILPHISPQLQRFILGGTDSELIFYYLLSQISKKIPLHTPITCPQTFSEIVQTCLYQLVEMVGDLTNNPKKGLKDENYLTILLTNGDLMLGFQGGQPLHYSTHKNRCPERDSCSYFATSCESPLVKHKTVNHLLISSEPLQGENIWNTMEPAEMVMVDESMQVTIKKLNIDFRKP